LSSGDKLESSCQLKIWISFFIYSAEIHYSDFAGGKYFALVFELYNMCLRH